MLIFRSEQETEFRKEVTVSNRMGPRDEQDDVIGGKGETEIKMLKQEVENIVEGLVSCLYVNDNYKPEPSTNVLDKGQFLEMLPS